MISFYLFLNRSYSRSQHSTLSQRFIIGKACKHWTIKYSKQFVSTKYSHNFVLWRNEKLCHTWISLSSGSSSQLIINSSGFMFFSPKNHESSKFGYSFSQFNIRPSSGHIGRDSYGTFLSSKSNDFRFSFVLFGIEYIMRNTFCFQSVRKIF